MTDPVQPTEEAVDAAVDAFGPLFGVGGDVRWHRGTAKEVVDAVRPLLRREVAAEWADELAQMQNEWQHHAHPGWVLDWLRRKASDD